MYLLPETPLNPLKEPWWSLTNGLRFSCLFYSSFDRLLPLQLCTNISSNFKLNWIAAGSGYTMCLLSWLKLQKSFFMLTPIPQFSPFSISPPHVHIQRHTHPHLISQRVPCHGNSKWKQPERAPSEWRMLGLPVLLRGWSGNLQSQTLYSGPL